MQVKLQKQIHYTFTAKRFTVKLKYPIKIKRCKNFYLTNHHSM